jgi:hypothetical protein
MEKGRVFNFSSHGFKIKLKSASTFFAEIIYRAFLNATAPVLISLLKHSALDVFQTIYQPLPTGPSPSHLLPLEPRRSLLFPLNP